MKIPARIQILLFGIYCMFIGMVIQVLDFDMLTNAMVVLVGSVCIAITWAFTVLNLGLPLFDEDEPEDLTEYEWRDSK